MVVDSEVDERVEGVLSDGAEQRGGDAGGLGGDGLKQRGDAGKGS